jgi:hypothetical protein
MWCISCIVKANDRKIRTGNQLYTMIIHEQMDRVTGIVEVKRTAVLCCDSDLRFPFRTTHYDVDQLHSQGTSFFSHNIQPTISQSLLPNSLHARDMPIDHVMSRRTIRTAKAGQYVPDCSTLTIDIKLFTRTPTQ